MLARVRCAASEMSDLRDNPEVGNAWMMRTLGRRLREATGAHEGIECLIAWLVAADAPVCPVAYRSHTDFPQSAHRSYASVRYICDQSIVTLRYTARCSMVTGKCHTTTRMCIEPPRNLYFSVPQAPIPIILAASYPAVTGLFAPGTKRGCYIGQDAS